MNFFKLLLIFTLVLFGTFAQRFLRHSNNDDALIDGKDFDNLLSSDVTNAQQFGDDVQFTGFIKEIQLQLMGNELMFEYCSKHCMNQRVYVCYDAENPSDTSSQFGCGPNQCRFEAGISRGERENRLWFMKPEYSTLLDNDKDICATAIMQSPTAKVTHITIRPPSCKPLITNGGKIKLSVKAATTECFLTVKNAKISIPTTTLAPTTPPPSIPSPATQSSPADEGEKDLWENVSDYFCLILQGWC